jgi:hypothetical protein
MDDILTNADERDDAAFRARLAPLASEVLPGPPASRPRPTVGLGRRGSMMALVGLGAAAVVLGAAGISSRWPWMEPPGNVHAVSRTVAVSPRSTASANPDAVTRVEPEAPRPAYVPPSSSSEAMIGLLLQRGDAAVSVGDIAAARLLYERAAAARWRAWHPGRSDRGGIVVSQGGGRRRRGSRGSSRAHRRPKQSERPTVNRKPPVFPDIEDATLRACLAPLMETMTSAAKSSLPSAVRERERGRSSNDNPVPANCHVENSDSPENLAEWRSSSDDDFALFRSIEIFLGMTDEELEIAAADYPKQIGGTARRISQFKRRLAERYDLVTAVSAMLERAMARAAARPERD